MNSTTAIQFSRSLSKNLLAQLKNSAFVKNVLVVMSGTALAQFISLALSPVISRLYSPTDFGVFGSFTAILAVVGAVLTLEYNQALMLPRQKGDAFGLFIVSLLSTLVITALCLAIVLVASGFILRSIKVQNAWVLVLLVTAILTSGLSQTFQGWCIRAKAFKRTSLSQVIRSASANGAQVGLGYLGGGSIALIFAATLGDVLATLNLAIAVLREPKILWRSIRWRMLGQLAKDYRDFPLYMASINVINTLSLGLPVFLLAHFYGIAAAGAYAFGIRLIQAPMELVLRALRQVLYQKAAETYNQGGRLVPLYTKITGGLFAAGLVPCLIMFIWAPQIFSFVFGARWQTAGVFVRSLVLWLLFMFCNLPAVLFTRIIRMQRRMFFYDQILLIARALALIIGGSYLTAPQTILLFSLVGAVMNVAYIIIIGFALMRMEGEVTFKDILNSMTKG